METTDLAQQLIEACIATKNTKLDLGKCGLTEIPEAVFDLDWLEELYLCNAYFDYEMQKWIICKNKGSNNKLAVLSSNLEKLENLKILFINGSYEWWNIPNLSILQKLPKLHTLNLRNNDISDLSSLKSLIHLDSLDLSSSRQNIDLSFLKKLANLNILYLKHNKYIKDFSFLNEFKQLKKISLSNTNICNLNFIQNLKLDCTQCTGHLTI